MSNKKKIVLAMVAVVALVSILAICLCACAKKTYPQTLEGYAEKLKALGYTEIYLIDENHYSDDIEEGLEEKKEVVAYALGVDTVDLEWYLYAWKDEYHCVEIFKFGDAETAQMYYAYYLRLNQELEIEDPEEAAYYGAEIDGTIVFCALKEGIKDARS